MVPTFTFQDALHTDIDLEDKTYSFSFGEDVLDDDLRKSIKRFGIIHPPILQQKSHHIYRIICGWKRIKIARDIEPKTPVHCRIIPADMNKSAIYSLILEETAAGKQLSIPEQILFFEKLIEVFTENEALPFLEQLGYKPQQHVLRDILKLSELSKPVLLSMHKNTISIKNARKLLKFSKNDQHLIVELIKKYHFGGSKQRKLIDLCSELIHRNTKPLEEILSPFFFSTEEERQPENLPQRATIFLSWLEKECFPRLSIAEQEFNRKAANLNLPSAMQITHTPAFENDEINLSLRFPDWESLETAMDKIKEAIEKKNNNS